jgi:hypothetical protein
MALAIVVTLEKELGNASAAYARARSGKALARETDRIDLAARTRRVRQLPEMLSESHAVLIEQMKAEGFDPSRMRLPPEKWFDAAEGLTTVRALIEHVGANLNHFKQPNPILRDLKAVEALLAAAQESGVRFHFTKCDLS